MNFQPILALSRAQNYGKTIAVMKKSFINHAL